MFPVGVYSTFVMHWKLALGLWFRFFFSSINHSILYHTQHDLKIYLLSKFKSSWRTCFGTRIFVTYHVLKEIQDKNNQIFPFSPHIHHKIKTFTMYYSINKLSIQFNSSQFNNLYLHTVKIMIHNCIGRCLIKQKSKARIVEPQGQQCLYCVSNLSNLGLKLLKKISILSQTCLGQNVSIWSQFETFLTFVESKLRHFWDLGS